ERHGPSVCKDPPAIPAQLHKERFALTLIQGHSSAEATPQVPHDKANIAKLPVKVERERLLPGVVDEEPARHGGFHRADVGVIDLAGKAVVSADGWVRRDCTTQARCEDSATTSDPWLGYRLVEENGVVLTQRVADCGDRPSKVKISAARPRQALNGDWWIS